MILHDGDISAYFVEDEVGKGEEQVFCFTLPFKYLSLCSEQKTLGIHLTRAVIDRLACGFLESVRYAADGELVRQQEWEYERAMSEREAMEELGEEE